MKIRLIVMLILLGNAAFARAETDCRMTAFVADPSSGVNVRDGAGLNSKILKTIPRDPKGTLVFIAGAKGEWLKISRAVNSQKTNVFSGAGWVHAPLLTVKTRGGGDDLVLYYRNPRTETEETGSIRANLEVGVLGCSDDWIKVLVPRRGTEGIAGWLPFGSFCGSPWEDCD